MPDNNNILQVVINVNLHKSLKINIYFWKIYVCISNIYLFVFQIWAHSYLLKQIPRVSIEQDINTGKLQLVILDCHQQWALI